MKHSICLEPKGNMWLEFKSAHKVEAIEKERHKTLDS